MAILLGMVIAFAVSLLAAIAGFDKDRGFYPTITVVIASYYVLFAVMGGAVETIAIEFFIMTLFTGIAVFGFKRNLWMVVVALLAHGVFDFFHDRLFSNPGAPAWWPLFCLGYDVTAAVYLSWLLHRSRNQGKRIKIH